MTHNDRSEMASLALAVEAVDWLCDNELSDAVEVYEPEDLRTAHAAVLRLQERFREVPKFIADALDGARSSGELLSDDRLQGLAEILQNADDANATEVRMLLRETDLLVGHDGDPVRLRHVLGLATPWLSTKGGEAASFGRHGIGLSALRSLSRTIEVHCRPYHVEFGDSTLSPIGPMELPAAFGRGNWTMFRVPIGDGSLEIGMLADWLDRWGDAGLLFLRSVGAVGLSAPSGETVRRLSVRRTEAGSEQLSVAPPGALVHRQLVEAPDDLSWVVYTAEVDSPKGVSRVRKAKEATTPIGVALPLHEATVGEVYAGLPVVETPLPVFVNAQFDPLTSRRDVAGTKWNQALVPLVADIWGHAAIDLLRRNPQAAWRAMPVGSSWDQETVSLVGRLNYAILDKARTTVANGGDLEVPGKGWLKLAELAVESEPLEGVVTEEETATLLGMQAALPTDARDEAGRWRLVWDDWRAAGADIAEPLSVERALELLRDERRSVRSTISLAAAGLRGGLGELLGTLPCTVAADGRRLVPPSAGAAEALAENLSPLAEELGIVTALHPGHLDDSEDAGLMIDWLRDRGALLDGTDDTVVVRRLAEAGRSGRELAQPLTDGQADALRRAFELIDVVERPELGRAVGRAIALRAYEYKAGGKGRRRRMVASPATAYQPGSVNRGKDSFAVAAGKTRGIVWLEGRYGKALRSPEGRAGIGAQRFLTLLGAETAPRPEPHPDLKQRFSGLQAGLRRLVDGSPSGRSKALADQGATYTLADSACPTMLEVIEDIASVPQSGKRRRRARALLATLVRGWGRLSDFAEVATADDYYTWRETGRTVAFWLWQARDVPWLDDESGTPRRPSELRIRTRGTEAIFGSDSPDFLHPDLVGAHPDRRNWPAVLSALGMSGDPTRRELVARLRELRDDDGSDGRAARSDAVVYKALAESLERSVSRSDLTKRELRQAFSEGDGLIATRLGWRPPSKVYADDRPVFGKHMPFAPLVPGTAELWNALQVRRPLLSDCINVLRGIARGRRPPDLEDEAVQLETLRLLVERYRESGSKADRRKLRRLALWTTEGWRRNRPVFATDDESLLNALGNGLPLWKPGGEMEQFQLLLEPLGVEVIKSAAAQVLDLEDSFEEPEATRLFRSAAQHLQEDLVRNEPLAARSIVGGRWDDLKQLTVWSHPKLTLAVDVPESAGGGRRRCPVRVKVDLAGQNVFVRDPQTDLPRADRGGRAVAGVFDGERRRVSQAWRSAWDRAVDGEAVAGLELAEQQAQREKEEMSAAIREDLEALRTRTGEKRKSKADGRGRASGSSKEDGRTAGNDTTGQNARNLAKPRVLVDPETLTVVDPRGQVVEGSPRDNRTPRRPSNGPVDPRGTKPSGPPTSRTPLRGYSDQEREDVGFELARRVLSSDDKAIVDLRRERGVGADAMDELERFYELKVSAGAEPNEISLTSAEWQRARSSPHFFLVIVSGVEGADAKPTIRVISHPLQQLEQRPSGTVKLSGVTDATSLTYRFARSTTNDDGNEVETGQAG